jgi:hypothetical protein
VVVNDGVVVEPERRVAVATIDFHAQGGDGWFPGMSLTPTTTTDTEQSSFIAWLTDARARDATLSSSGRIHSSDAPAPARCR